MDRGGPVQCFEGRKCNSLILHCGDGYHYNIREIKTRRIRLNCRHRQADGRRCLATAKVCRTTGYLTHLKDHNHDPDSLLKSDFGLRTAMITEARRSCKYGEKVRSILNRLRLRTRNVDLASRFTRVRMNSALYAARSESYPPIPCTLLFLGVLLGTANMHAVCKTADGLDYIFQGVVGNAVMKTVAIVFSSGRMLQFLQSRESIHADGTFKKRPRKPKCMQIFNLVTKYGDNVIAIVRVLMRCRTENAYVEVLNFTKSLAPNWNPRRVHCDFERAQMNAFRIVFPLCRVVGCLWHYAVRIGDRARTIGLGRFASENQLVLSFIRSLGAVPLLPEHLMWRGVVELWQEVEVSGWGQEFLPLFQYFEQEWKPRFAELSVFNVDDRTNNCSESDNRMLANAIPQNHPNIWNLIGGFVQLEFISWSDKIALDNFKAVAPARRYSAVSNDRKVQMASRMLVNGDITPGHFLQRASYAIHAAALHGLRMQNDSDSEDSDSD